MLSSTLRGSGKRAPSRIRASLNKNPKVEYNVPTRNQFSTLKISDPKGSEPRPSSKPAPVTVTDNANLSDILKEVNVQHSLKIVSIGTKIFVNNETDFKALCDKLRERKTEFFTHPFGMAKTFKLILSGLPEVPTDDIIDHLKTHCNVKVTKVIMLTSTSSFKRYVLQFDPREVTKADIKNIKVVLNHLIKWLPAKQRNKGPTQCLNCGMFGHGIGSCHRKTKCFLCAENHETKSCTFNAESTVQRIFKCNNCKSNNMPHNHKANDANCPSRMKYLEIKTNMNKKRCTVTQNFVHTNEAFPPLLHAPPPPPLTQSFAHAAKQQHRHSATTDDRHMRGDNTLFTFAELSEIMLNCVNELSQCTSKLEQIRVIANLLGNVCK